MDVVTLDTPQLGNRSYLLHDGGDGLVVDPVRDVDRIETAAEGAGVRIVAVAETHIHNDYVSGGLALARRHRADYLVAAESVAFDRAADPGRDPVRSRRGRGGGAGEAGAHAASPGVFRDAGRRCVASPHQRRQPAIRDGRAHGPARSGSGVGAMHFTYWTVDAPAADPVSLADTGAG